MSDHLSFTAEHRSWQWEMVHRFEEGSLPASDWNPTMLNLIAQWYAKNLEPDQARQRYTQHYERNRRRLTNRLGGGSSVPTEALDAVDAVWESLLEKALPPAPKADAQG